MITFSPDNARPGGLKHRDNVLVRYSTHDVGDPVVVFMGKPLSMPSSTPAKRSPATMLDEVGVLLSNHKVNPDHLVSVDKSGGVPCLLMAPSSYISGYSTTKALDVATALRKAQYQGKSSARCSALPFIPVVVP